MALWVIGMDGVVQEDPLSLTTPPSKVMLGLLTLSHRRRIVKCPGTSPEYPTTLPNKLNAIIL